MPSVLLLQISEQLGRNLHLGQQRFSRLELAERPQSQIAQRSTETSSSAGSAAVKAHQNAAENISAGVRTHLSTHFQ